MLYLDDPGLGHDTIRGLRSYQAEVDSAGTYAEQVDAGKKLFDRYSRPRNPVFRGVRKRLSIMGSGARRCGYCEDSAAAEIEHIEPKDLYPENVFVWENYLPACGQCNRGKSNRFSVLRRGRLVDITRRRGDPVHRPPRGPAALISPRVDDPLDFLALEVLDTFMFLPREGLPGIEIERARYTIEVLNLNREILRVARRDAYGAYRARLYEYRARRANGA